MKKQKSEIFESTKIQSIFGTQKNKVFLRSHKPKGFTRKAQAAVETLMIYGVTILIVMLAIGALIGFGIIDFDSFFPDKCSLPEVLSCEAFLVTPTEVQLQFENIFDSNIGEFSVNLYGEKDNEGLWNCNTTVYSGGTLVVGEVSSVIYVPCEIKVPTGKKINGKMQVKFKQAGLEIQRSILGDIRSSVSE